MDILILANQIWILSLTLSSILLQSKFCCFVCFNASRLAVGTVGRASNSQSKGHGFKPHQQHQTFSTCMVLHKVWSCFLSQLTYAMKQ